MTHRTPKPGDRLGHGMSVLPMGKAALARFMAKVEKQSEITSPHVDTPCWLWMGGKSRGGYGAMEFGYRKRGTRRSVLVHRLSFAHWRKDPGALCVCHRCDTPSCVNPDHLFLGTRAVNNADMRRKGRSVIPRGERNGSAKLTRADVRSITLRLQRGESQQLIARRFGVSQASISKIARGVSWSHVTRISR